MPSPSPLDPLIDIIHTKSEEPWKARNEKALAALFGTRYTKRAEKSVTLRAPEMKGGDESGVPYAAYIDPSNPSSGGYGGMSFVIFPVDDGPCLLGMVLGTQGLAPDEAILGRPGHARKLQAVCAWLNRKYGEGQLVAWAKQDPTRTDIEVPETIRTAWQTWKSAFRKYGKEMYALYRPTGNRAGTLEAVAAMLDIMFEERGHEPLAGYKDDAEAIEASWFAHLMPTTTQATVADLLQQRKYVIIQGPPGTGKTTLADTLLKKDYEGRGDTIQFHPNTTYETFVGGLAPVQESANATLGFRFAPKAGFLIEAAAQAAADPAHHYLLHIDEINRADLGKILGEAIYLFEADAPSRRELTLAYDFGEPFGRRLWLPDNLHILGTMNSADRSIAILDVAVRRRFAFVSLWPSQKVVEDHGCELGEQAFRDLVQIFIEHATEEGLPLVPGHSYFLGRDEAATRIKLKTSLVPLLTEYLAQGYVSGFAEPVRAYLQWLESL